MRYLPLVLTLFAISVVTDVAAAPLGRREVLPNAMRLLVAERPAIPIVVVRLFVRAGSAYDPSDTPGLANLTAELLTRGTARRTGPQLDQAIEFVGGSLEATASRDGVTVSLNVLKKDLELGLDLLAEVILTPTFPEDELKRKVAEIQASLRRSEENPEVVAGREMTKLLYPNHPYGHPVPGTIESVGQLTREQVVGFHRRHYRPDMAVVAVVGDVTVDAIRQGLGRRFAGWTAPAEAPVQIPPAPENPPVEQRTIKRDLTQATVLLGRPGVRQVHPDYFPLIVANYILGGGSASQLYTRVREERGFAYFVHSNLSPGRYGASYIVSLQTRLDAVDEAVRLVKEEMVSLGKGSVPAGALDLAKSFLIGSLPLRLDTSGKVADFLINIEENGLGLDYPDRFRTEVAKVTAADVERVSARYLAPATFSSVIVRK